MTWFQFLAFFLAMLAVGCVASDNIVDIINRIENRRDV